MDRLKAGAAMKRYASLLLILFAMIKPSFGQSIPLDPAIPVKLTLEHEVDLSDETKRLIEALPKALGDELIRAINALDTSVQGWLDRVDELVIGAILQLDCTTKGTVERAGQQISASLPDFRIEGLLDTGPVGQALTRYKNKRSRKVGPNSRIHSVYIFYLDRLDALEGTRCSLLADPAKEEITKTVIDAAHRVSVWKWLSEQRWEDNKPVCGRVKGCYSVTYARIAAAFEDIDPRHWKYADLAESFGELTAPENVEPFRTRLRLRIPFRTKQGLDEYETELGKLYAWWKDYSYVPKKYVEQYNAGIDLAVAFWDHGRYSKVFYCDARFHNYPADLVKVGGNSTTYWDPAAASVTADRLALIVASEPAKRCVPADHCDSSGEFCGRKDRERGCLVNREWVAWFDNADLITGIERTREDRRDTICGFQRD